MEITRWKKEDDHSCRCFSSRFSKAELLVIFAQWFRFWYGVWSFFVGQVNFSSPDQEPNISAADADFSDFCYEEKGGRTSLAGFLHDACSILSEPHLGDFLPLIPVWDSCVCSLWSLSKSREIHFTTKYRLRWKTNDNEKNWPSSLKEKTFTRSLCSAREEKERRNIITFCSGACTTSTSAKHSFKIHLIKFIRQQYNFSEIGKPCFVPETLPLVSCVIALRVASLISRIPSIDIRIIMTLRSLGTQGISFF